MFRIPTTFGEVVDRLTILRVKYTRLPTAPARAAAGNRARQVAEAFLTGWQTPGALGSLATQDVERALTQVHQQLWDAEDQLRLAAAALSTVDEVDVDKWLELASPRTCDNPAYLQLKSYLAAAQEIRRLNQRRHELVGQLDQLAGDQSEPKHYQGEQHVGQPTACDGNPGPPDTPAT